MSSFSVHTKIKVTLFLDTDRRSKVAKVWLDI